MALHIETAAKVAAEPARTGEPAHVILTADAEDQNTGPMLLDNHCAPPVLIEGGMPGWPIGY